MSATRPWIHPQAQARIDAIAGSGEPPLETLDVETARAVVLKRLATTAGTGRDVGRCEDRALDTAAGRVPVRIYWPMSQATQPLPILVYCHGGGFVVGNIDTTDAMCREFTIGANCITVSVDYRLAPEHKFPAAIDDSYAATRWVAEHAAELGGDPSRLALAGESAGGTLAAAISALARDSGDFSVVQQILIYAGLDQTMSGNSYERLGEGYFLTRPKMRWFRDHYLNSPDDALDPRASPLLANDFSRLPPTLVVTASLDPLVDEGEAYAEGLRAAGVPTEYACMEGWVHGYLYWDGCEARRETMDRSIAVLKRAFAVRSDSHAVARAS